MIRRLNSLRLKKNERNDYGKSKLALVLEQSIFFESRKRDDISQRFRIIS